MPSLCPRWLCRILYVSVVLLTVFQWVVCVKALSQCVMLLSSPYTSLSILQEGLVLLCVPLILAVLVINLGFAQIFLADCPLGLVSCIVERALVVLPLNICTLACGSFLFFI